MRGMVVDAKAKGLQVLLALFGPYGIDQQPACPRPSRQGAGVQQPARRACRGTDGQPRAYVGTTMGPDGLHPTQTGYDEMADRSPDKLLTMFPRCGRRRQHLPVAHRLAGLGPWAFGLR